MKTPIKIITLGIVVLGITNLSACNHHKKWHHEPEERAERILDWVTDELDLDSGQQQQLQTLSKQLLEVRAEMSASHDQHLNQIQQMLEAPTLDQDQALQIMQEKIQTVEAKMPTLIASFAEFHDALNAEQKAELQTRLKKYLKRRQQ